MPRGGRRPTHRQSQMQERLQQGTKQLEPLKVGQEVAIQDPPTGGRAGRWTKLGAVIEVLPYDAYQVRIHGSWHISKRNSNHLRKIAPFNPEVKLYPAASPEAQSVPQETITEAEDRFVAVQPPPSSDRLSLLHHRQQPAGQPGEDVVSKLKQAQKEGR